MGLRTAVFDALSASPALLALGLTTDNLYPNEAPDSPDDRLFCVLRWGTSDRKVGPDTTVRPIDLQAWVYDRETDFSRIVPVLRAIEVVLLGLVGKPTGSGWVLGVEEQGQGPDLWDPAYQAALRSGAFRIVASGE